MRLRNKLRNLWCYFNWYVYTPYWHWIYLPMFGNYSIMRKPVSRWRRGAVDAFWNFVAAVENSPEVFNSFVVWFFSYTSRLLLSFSVVSVPLSWFNKFLNIYFKIVNFRSLLFAYILADFFYYHWSSEGINDYLSIWNIFMLIVFFKVLYLLMDGADGKLSLFSHDLITSLYLSKYQGVDVSDTLTAEQMSDPFISSYVKISHKSNLFIAVFGFLYTGQPLFRVYI